MIDDGIHEGDYVVVRRQQSADNGETVVAMVYDEASGGSEATVKRFFKERARIRLQPANKRMKPMYFDDVQIAGKVVGLVRAHGVGYVREVWERPLRLPIIGARGTPPSFTIHFEDTTMPHIENEVLVNAPLEKVYALAKDVETFPQFMPDVESIHVAECSQ